MPPPLPDPSKTNPLNYAGPRSSERPPASADQSQKIFDTIVGPNLRLRDNLIQLACVIVGGGAGAGIGFGFGKMPGMAVGLIVGLLGALILSGAVIGIVRFIAARKR